MLEFGSVKEKLFSCMRVDDPPSSDVEEFKKTRHVLSEKASKAYGVGVSDVSHTHTHTHVKVKV
jgi:hypothetical protein